MYVELVRDYEYRLAIEIVVSNLDLAFHSCYWYLHVDKVDAAQC
jgi:hypothetical protein